MKLKICGIRREIDVDYVNEVLPDYAGFVFASSKRQVTLLEAEKLIRQLRPEIKPVGIFVNEPLDQVIEIVDQAGLSAVQLHGDEERSFVESLRKKIPQAVEIWKAVRLKSEQDICEAEVLPVEQLLMDAYSEKGYGGTGEQANWSLLQKRRPKLPFFLAGGLNRENLRQAIELVKPHGIDISGGVETDGWKDLAKMKQIKELMKG